MKIECKEYEGIMNVSAEEALTMSTVVSSSWYSHGARQGS